MCVLYHIAEEIGNMGCNCCNSNDKLEKLFTFLGIDICYECKGRGRIEKRSERGCSCCERETVTCPECKGSEFLVEDDSILKTLIDCQDNQDSQDDSLSNIGLCD